jgi:hypothetical protein
MLLQLDEGSQVRFKQLVHVHSDLGFDLVPLELAHSKLLADCGSSLSLYELMYLGLHLGEHVADHVVDVFMLFHNK